MQDTRNIAILSHSGAGKTSLTEALLYRAGVIPAPGRVEDGNTASDFTPEEQRRKISIYSTVHPLEWRGNHINNIATPGYSDFDAQIRGAVLAGHAARIVICATSGPAVCPGRLGDDSFGQEMTTRSVF